MVVLTSIEGCGTMCSYGRYYVFLERYATMSFYARHQYYPLLWKAMILCVPLTSIVIRPPMKEESIMCSCKIH